MSSQPYIEIHGNDVDGFEVLVNGCDEPILCTTAAVDFSYEPATVYGPIYPSMERSNMLTFGLKLRGYEPRRKDPAETDEGIWLH